jgi:ribosomal protein S18 acetylase RimI-like enzyme
MEDILEVRRAGMGDFDLILGMIEGAAAWLRNMGTDQWALPWPTRKARDNRVLRGLQQGKTWLVESGHIPVATITCRQHGNNDLWNNEERKRPALYVSRLIVTRKHTGLEIGSALVDWAALRAQSDWSAQCVRIDVWTTNVALHSYYEKRGFRFCRFAADQQSVDYPSAALFEKSMTEVDPEAASRFRTVAA